MYLCPTPVYADARLIAVRWLKQLKRSNPKWGQTYPNWAIERSLKNLLELINSPRPSHLGIERTTRRIGAVRDQLLKRGAFGELTPVAKAKWTKLLDHNRHDVRGMMNLVEKVVEGFVPRGIDPKP
jgi:hypothetical protein